MPMRRQTGAAFIELALSLGILLLISLGGYSLITTLNQNQMLHDVLRRSAMSIQKLDIEPSPAHGSSCVQSISILNERLTAENIDTTKFSIKACPITLSNPDDLNELSHSAISIHIESTESSFWGRFIGKVSLVIPLLKSIANNSSNLNCPEVVAACS